MKVIVKWGFSLPGSLFVLVQFTDCLTCPVIILGRFFILKSIFNDFYKSMVCKQLKIKV